MFTIEQKTENGFQVIYLHDNNNGVRVGILPDHGALLHAFNIQVNNDSFNIIDNYQNIDDLNQNLTTSYKSAKLSPFVCRTKDGKYTLEGEEFEFENKFPDGSAIHGLIYNTPFIIKESFVTESNACLELTSSYKKEDKGFPYSYDCEIKYSLLNDGSLRVLTSVKNTGDQPMPLADGWHPYFRLGGKVDDYEIRFNSTTMLEFSDELIPTGNFLNQHELLEEGAIGERSYDNCFLLKDCEEDSPVCELKNPGNGLELSIYAEENYPYLQIYIPPHRESIAIENLSGAPNCFNNRMGLMMLKPGESARFSTRYKVSKTA